jgi:hypothetical protein
MFGVYDEIAVTVIIELQLLFNQIKSINFQTVRNNLYIICLSQ